MKLITTDADLNCVSISINCAAVLASAARRSAFPDATSP